MSVIDIGYRILISNYGYYGSINQPYVIYEIEIDKTKIPVIENKLNLMASIYPRNNFNCKFNDTLIEKLEHIIIDIQNTFYHKSLNCLHEIIAEKNISRFEDGNCLILPMSDRVVISDIISFVVDFLNMNNDGHLSGDFISEIEDRILAKEVQKITNFIMENEIPIYDIEDDSRLLVVGEAENRLIIKKSLVNNNFLWLKDHQQEYDYDTILNEKWSRIKKNDIFILSSNLNDAEIIYAIWPELQKLLTSKPLPKFLISGTNGKTSTSRILSHILREGFDWKIGMTSTSGIYIDGKAPLLGDYTGPWSARNLLLEPVDAAVFEVARGGLIREGVIFKKVDTSILTNVAADHLGLRGINTEKQMADLKKLIYYPATKSVILNMDNKHIRRIHKDITKGTMVLPFNPQIWGVSINRERLNDINFGIYLSEGDIYLKHLNNKDVLLGNVNEMEISNYGLVSFMNLNALYALAAAISYNIEPSIAFSNLKSMKPDLKNSLGRGNLFFQNNRWFMFDYGHNPHALDQILKTIVNIKNKYEINKIIFLALTAGDRSNEDIKQYGVKLSKFPIDDLVFKDMWVDLRGRKIGEIGLFLEKIVKEYNFKGKIYQIPNPEAAIVKCLELSREKDLVYLCAEKADVMMDLIQKFEFH